MASSSNFKENSWESASNDHSHNLTSQAELSGDLPQQAAATSARPEWHDARNSNRNRSSLDVSDGIEMHHDNRHARRNDARQGRGHQTRCESISFGHVLYTLDVLVTLLLVIFVGYILHYRADNDHHHSPQQSAMLIVCGFLAVMIACRCFLSWFLLPTKRCSKSCSTHLTLLLCGTYTVLAMAAWIVANKKHPVPWCWSLGSWCATRPNAVPACFSVLALIEALRFVFAQGQMAQFDQDHPQAQGGGISPPPPHDEESFGSSRRRRPWWWNRSRGHENDSNMHASLIGNNGQPRWTNSGNQSYLMDDGVEGTPSSRGLLSGWFGRIRNNDSNPRDDGSVDYESLNEEWASRTEEDPYWWTKEENNARNATQQGMTI